MLMFSLYCILSNGSNKTFSFGVGRVFSLAPSLSESLFSLTLLMDIALLRVSLNHRAF